MKHLVLFSLALIMGAPGFAQSLTSELDSVFSTGSATDADFYQNTNTMHDGDMDVEVNWQSEVLSMPQGWEVSHCFPTCHDIGVTSGSATIPAGAGVYTNTHFYPHGVPGTGIVKILMVETGSLTNTHEVVFVGSATDPALSVGSLPNDNTTWKLYPNPAQSSIVLQAGNGSLNNIRVFDALGAEVFPARTWFGQQVIQLELDALPAGLYVVSGKSDAGSPMVLRFMRQ